MGTLNRQVAELGEFGPAANDQDTTEPSPEPEPTQPGETVETVDPDDQDDDGDTDPEAGV